MIGIIATAVLGLAAMGEGEEPEEDEDLLTLLGHVLSVEVLTTGGGEYCRGQEQLRYEVFIYGGNERIGHGRGSMESSFIEAIAHAEPSWPLQELRESAVNALVRNSYVTDRREAYEILDEGLVVYQDTGPHDSALDELHDDSPWYTGRAYA